MGRLPRRPVAVTAARVDKLYIKLYGSLTGCHLNSCMCGWAKATWGITKTIVILKINK